MVPRPLLIRLSYIARPILARLYKGNTYTDPIDGKSYKKFLPYGYETQRENVLSPSTLSLERHRLLWLYLKNETTFFTTPQKVLHFAPEQAFYKRFRSLEHLDYTTTDLNSPLADVKADICNLPFQDNAYDFILCNHVLEHIPDHHKAISELYRVLKPGLILWFPIRPILGQMKWTAYSQRSEIMTQSRLLRTAPMGMFSTSALLSGLMIL